MYANTQYRPAAQQWTAIDPAYSQHFVSNKLTQTRGGSQVLETQQPTKPGIGGKISNIVHRVEERFAGNANSRWAAFGLAEPLMAEYTAKTAYGNTRIGGWIFLSQGHFGWISYTDSQNRVIKTLIPWANVMDIVPTARIRGQATNNYEFSPIRAPGAVAEGFQIFTKDNLVYQFFGLKKNIEMVFNLFNQLWVPSYGVRPGFTSGLHHGGYVRSVGNTGYGQTGLATGLAQPGYGQTGLATGYGQTGLAQPGYGQTGLATGLAQPGYGQTGLATGYGQTGLAQPGYGQTGLATGYGQTGLAQTGLAQTGYGQTGLATGLTPATYGQTTSIVQPGYAQSGLTTGYGQTGLASGFAPQQAVYGQGLAGQAYAGNTVLAKEGYVQPQTGMALGQTAPTNYRNL